MSFREPSREEMLSSCSDVGPDDGVDPRLPSHAEKSRVRNRKALQLCDQVAQTLGAVLAWECRDDLLRDLMVESVTPAPNSGCLLVTVRPADADSDPAEALARLQRAAGKLRADIAAAIHRKKVPLLAFRITERQRPDA